MTLLFFPVCVILAWIADRRLLFYRYMGKRYRADKRHGIVVETEGDLTPSKGGMEMIVDGKFPPRGGAVVPAENYVGGAQDGTTGAATNNFGAGAMATDARGKLPNSNSTMVNVESSKELDESRREVRDEGGGERCTTGNILTALSTCKAVYYYCASLHYVFVVLDIAGNTVCGTSRY